MFFANFWTGLSTCVFMFDVCLETFPFCYLCDVIMNDCQELADTLFQSNWMAADRRYKATLVYFLHNLQQPIVLTAGGIFPICMQTNLSVSYFSISSSNLSTFLVHIDGQVGVFCGHSYETIELGRKISMKSARYSCLFSKEAYNY